MKVDRDQFFKVVQRMRKNLVQGQVDAWHSMIRLLRGQAQHDKQIEIVASANGLEWREWIDAEFGPGDWRGKIGTSPAVDFTSERIGCEALYRALKDHFNEATDLNMAVEITHLRLTSPQDAKQRAPVLLPCQPTHVHAVVEHSAKVEPKALYRLLASVAHARGKDETRPHLAGVELALTSAGLRATATDGHRLATAVAESVWPDHTEETILLPGAAVDSLLAALRGCVDAHVELAIGPKALAVEGSTFAVSALASDAIMLPWRQVCPREYECNMMPFKGAAEPLGLRNIIEQANRVKGANINAIFTFDHSWLTIQVVADDDSSKVLETVKTEIATAPLGRYPQTLKAGFNLKYWTEALDSIPKNTEINLFYQTGDLYPIMIKAGNMMHLIVPARL